MSYKVRCTAICNGCGKEGPAITSDASKIPRESLANLSNANGFVIDNGEFYCTQCWPNRHNFQNQSSNNEKRIKVGPVGDIGAAKPRG